MILRDSFDTPGHPVVESLGLDAFCEETIRKYRTTLRLIKPSLTWNTLSDEEFLYNINAIGKRSIGGSFHPTPAGLLMFGYHHTIIQAYPYYHLEYREDFGYPASYVYSLASDSGTWSGNLYDFFHLVSPKLELSVKRPFKSDGWYRVDDTPTHKAVRELLLNTLVHANYYERGGVSITNDGLSFTFSNPGLMQVSLKDAIKGGLSDPGKPTLFTMFTLINLGERAGSGLYLFTLEARRLGRSKNYSRNST